MTDIRRVLCLGDVVGKPGLRGIQQQLRDWRRELGADVVICNAENAVDGSGLKPVTVKALLKAGCDVLTSGDHHWRRSEIRDCREPRLLRPANFPATGGPGFGWGAYDLAGLRLGVINLMGQVFMRPCDSPFASADRALQELGDCDLIVVDLHAEATSEKAALGHYLDGRVAAVFGTHTHVPTADEQVLPGGTGFISDIGMCGAHRSIIGRRIEPVVTSLATLEHRPFAVASQDVRLKGVLFSLDLASGHCQAVERQELRIEAADAD